MQYFQDVRQETLMQLWFTCLNNGAHYITINKHVNTLQKK